MSDQTPDNTSNNQQQPNPINPQAMGLATLDLICREYLGSVIQSRHIFNQNGANLVYTHGCDMANKLGLNDRQKMNITPFPSPTSIQITQPAQAEQSQQAERAAQTQQREEKAEQPETSRTKSALKTAAIVALGAALGATGLAAGPAAISVINEVFQTNQSQNTTDPATPRGQGNVGFSVES